MIVTGLAVVDGVGFDARRELPNRKHLKLMGRGVQLGAAAVGRALASRAGWESVPPERRGLFVGASPQASDPDDLLPALAAPGGFGANAQLVPPLWLVKGLSNNVLGYASAYWDLQGPNGNRCEGRAGGLAAIVEGMRAVAEGRVDLAIAGGADSLVGLEAWLGRPVGEGAAFVVIERDGVGPRLVDGAVVAATGSFDGVDLGAATGAMELVRRLLAGERAFTVVVSDEAGTAWIRVE